MAPLCPLKFPFQDDLSYGLIDCRKEFIELSRAYLASSALLEKGQGKQLAPLPPPLFIA